MPQSAFAGDCAAHYVINCEECENTRIRNLIWSLRSKPHFAVPTEKGDSCLCFLPIEHDVHGGDLKRAVAAAKLQRKTYLKYLDSL